MRLHGLVDRDEVVLLVIDVQERLLPHVHEGDRVARRIAKLLQFADITDLPVIVTEQLKLGDTVDTIRGEIPGVTALPKFDFGCFRDDAFCDSLIALGRRTLVLTGIETHICVAQTALGAPPGYQVHVVTDAVSSRDPGDHAAALDRMRDAGCTMTTSEMFIYEILQCAGTDEFRAVLKLVKDSD